MKTEDNNINEIQMVKNFFAYNQWLLKKMKLVRDRMEKGHLLKKGDMGFVKAIILIDKMYEKEKGNAQ